MLMELDISNLKKGYISAGEAVKISHYTRDYIGQLCRKGKISGCLVSGVWYLDPEELLSYKRNYKPVGKKAKLSPAPLDSRAFKYERDLSPLHPPLSRKGKSASSIISATRISQGLVIFSLMIFLGASAVALSSKAVNMQIAQGYISNTASVSETVLVNGFSKLRDYALNPYLHSRDIP